MTAFMVRTPAVACSAWLPASVCFALCSASLRLACGFLSLPLLFHSSHPHPGQVGYRQRRWPAPSRFVWRFYMAHEVQRHGLCRDIPVAVWSRHVSGNRRRLAMQWPAYGSGRSARPTSSFPFRQQLARIWRSNRITRAFSARFRRSPVRRLETLQGRPTRFRSARVLSRSRQWSAALTETAGVLKGGGSRRNGLPKRCCATMSWRICLLATSGTGMAKADAQSRFRVVCNNRCCR